MPISWIHGGIGLWGSAENRTKKKKERMSEPNIPLLFKLLLAIHLRAKTQSERNGSFLAEKEEQCLKYHYRLGCLINKPTVTIIAQVS